MAIDTVLLEQQLKQYRIELIEENNLVSITQLLADTQRVLDAIEAAL